MGAMGGWFVVGWFGSIAGALEVLVREGFGSKISPFFRSHGLDRPSFLLPPSSSSTLSRSMYQSPIWLAKKEKKEKGGTLIGRGKFES